MHLPGLEAGPLDPEPRELTSPPSPFIRFIKFGNDISISFPVNFKKCSATKCYKFYRAGKTWTENQNSCKAEGGDLVSMETEAEWQFVNKEVQKIKLPGFTPSEWHIGLEKTASWTWEGEESNPLPIFTWVSGQHRSPYKWQSGQPSNDGDFVVMSKASQGTFKVIPDDERRPYICELPKGKGEAKGNS